MLQVVRGEESPCTDSAELPQDAKRECSLLGRISRSVGIYALEGIRETYK